MIAIVRIKGQVKVRGDFIETMERMNLKKKFSCIVIEKPNAEQLGMLKKIENFVAYGEISSEMYKKLVEARGQKDKKNIFRLHPPRKGIDSKLHFGIKKGVLGNNGKEIDKLVERML